MSDARFIEDFTATFAWFDGVRAGDPLWLREARRRAAADLRAAGLPTRRHEDWRYTSLRPVTERRLRYGGGEAPDAAAVVRRLVGPDDLALVYVGGELSTTLSTMTALPGGLMVSTLEAAVKADHPAVRAAFDRRAAADAPLALYNTALSRDGLVIDVAPGTVCPRLLHVIHLAAGSDVAETPAYCPRLILNLGESSGLRVAETYAGTAAARLVSAVTDATLARASALTVTRTVWNSPGSRHFGQWNTTLAAESRLTHLNLVLGGRLTRNDMRVDLAGSGASATLDGLTVAGTGCHADNHTVIDHQAPQAASRQHYRHVLDGDGRAVFDGQVLVRRDAQGTNAFQLNRTLLLSPTAEIDTKPALRIDADDVKCSHGATVGQLDPEQLFYLVSRGITPDDARRLLTRAFTDEILLTVAEDPALRRVLQSLVAEAAHPAAPATGGHA